MDKINAKSNATFASLALAALGIVYGDIGTSPLYAIRAALNNLPVDKLDILGILSLIFWSLMIVISIKYLWLVFRADNDGEGGILALLALLRRVNANKPLKWLFLIGIFAAGLMIGDGMLTPAISVLSAIEGVKVAAPSISELIIPISIVILIGLFLIQHIGTEKIGFAFGPLILLWFLLIGCLGLWQIHNNPCVLYALNPWYAAKFFQSYHWQAYAVLGGIFLVMTGGEALYADLGHFGKNPIRFSWFTLVLPGLLLNYFGQGAYLMNHPDAISNPFFLIAPTWFSIPLLVIATIATIIASQAVISGTFSLTKQAVLLGLYPRLSIIQTSETQKGQIYIPQINFILAVGTLSIVLLFRNSDAIAHAYGIAVNLVMVLTSTLIIYVAHGMWRWSLVKILLIFGPLLLVDLAFLGANLEKLETGGWLPVIFALVCAFIMYTWYKGMEYMRHTFYKGKKDLREVLNQPQYKTLQPLPGLTSVFITDFYDKSGGSFLHFLKLSHTLPENILILSYAVENIPYVSSKDRYECIAFDKNICKLVLHYGFMDFISVPQALYVANDRGILPFKLDVESVVYWIEVPNIVASEKIKSLAFYWQEKLFAFLCRNYSANLDIEFYQLPHNRSIAIGTYCVI